MRIIADFHLHSKYSRATSRDMDLDHIALWSKRKGIDLVGTADFTHPIWLGQIKKELAEDGSGFLTKAGYKNLKFILTGEVSSIYTQDGKVRKIHTLIFVPDIRTAQKINEKLTGIGNLYSDGRPIIGLAAKDLAKIILNINPRSLIIPAHIWTPWFSLFGSNSGFDSIEDCFGPFSKNISAVETGLSSDPEMNWRLSALDNISLISNSDAHSPANLGREANVFDLTDDEYNYDFLAKILKGKDSSKFLETIEFYPEEGRYHFDGHRNCNIIANPFETKYPGNKCPKCGKKLTIGVMNRVEEMADRKPGYSSSNFPRSRHLVPLQEIIAEIYGVRPTSQRVQKEYLSLISRFGNELNILINMSDEELGKNLDVRISDGIRRVREGNISVEPGYDGVYGKVNVFAGSTEKVTSPQASLF